MAFPLAVGDPVGDALRVCGIQTAMMHRAINYEGFVNLEDFGIIPASETNDLIKRMAGRTQAQAGYKFGTVHAKRIQALIWWVNDRQARDQPIVAGESNAAALASALQ